MAPDPTTRQTVAVPPGRTTFEHQHLISWGPVGAPLDEAAVPRPVFSLCSTWAPATRCECGYYDLHWSLAHALEGQHRT